MSVEDPMLELERQYEPWVWKDRLARENLPINDILPKFVDYVRNNQVVILEADTGAGKTRYASQALRQEFPGEMIYLTQLTRNAVEWNGATIAEDCGEKPGDSVGWHLRGEKPVLSEETKLQLLIDQSLVNKIVREGTLPEGILVIDEAHVRNVQTDVLLGLIKEYLPTSPKTRVVITSATIKADDFLNFYEGSKHLKAEGRNYPVRVEPYRLGKYEHHSQGAASALCDLVDRFARNELYTPEYKEGDDDILVDEGTAIVLLPGKDDIASVRRSVERLLAEKNIDPTKVEILDCHAEMSRADKNKVTKPLKKGVLRVVLGTEIVRNSVTAPDVVAVVDSLQIKRNFTNEKGVAHLAKIAISMPEAIQGMGRGGRTCPSLYIPISFEQEYEKLSPFPIPAILREPIGSVVLQLAAIGKDIENFPLINRPDAVRIKVAKDRLKKIGALDESEKITPLGEVLVRFPIDPERAKSLMEAEKLKVLPETVIATAVIENEGFYFSPRRGEKPTLVMSEQAIRAVLAGRSEREMQPDGEVRQKRPEEIDLSKLPEWVEARRNGTFAVVTSHRQFEYQDYIGQEMAGKIWEDYAGDSKSDFVAAVNAYRDYRKAKSNIKRAVERHNNQLGKGDKPWSEDFMLRIWCQERCFNLKRLEYIDRTVDMLVDEIASSPLKLEQRIADNRDFDGVSLMKALAAGMVDNVLRKGDGGNYEGPLGSKIRLSYGSVVASRSPALVFVGGVRKSKEGDLYADMVAAVEPEWLMDIVPGRIKSEWKKDSIGLDPYSDAGRIVATNRIFLDDLEIKSEKLDPPDEMVAEFIARKAYSYDSSLHHPDGIFNKEVAAYVKSLQYRMMPAAGQGIDVVKWYAQKLLGCRTYDDARQVDLKLTAEVLSELLGEDFGGYVERVRAVYPDQVEIGGVMCEVDYYRDYAEKPVDARIKIPIGLMETLKPNDVSQIADAKIRVRVMYKGGELYTDDLENWDEVLRKSDELRVRRLWETFENKVVRNLPSIRWRPDSGQQAPQLPEDEYVWDDLRGSLAYPAWKEYYSNASEFKLEWYKTKELAEEAMAVFDEKLHFEERVAEAQKAYLEIAHKFEEILSQSRGMAYGLDAYEQGAVEGSYESGIFKESVEYKLEEIKHISGLGHYKAQPREVLLRVENLKLRLKEAEEYKMKNDSLREPVAAKASVFLENYKKVEERFGERLEIAAAPGNLNKELSAGHFIGAQNVMNIFSESLQKYLERIEREERGEIELEPTVPLHNSGNGRACEYAWVVTPQGGVLKPRHASDDEAQFDDIGKDDLIVLFGHSNYGYEYEESYTVHRLPGRISDEQMRALEELRQSQQKYFVGSLGGWNLTKKGKTVLKTKYKSEFRDYFGEGYEYRDGDKILADEFLIQRSDDEFVVVPEKKRKTMPPSSPLSVARTEDNIGDEEETSMAAAWRMAQEKREHKKKKENSIFSPALDGAPSCVIKTTDGQALLRHKDYGRVYRQNKERTDSLFVQGR